MDLSDFDELLLLRAVANGMFGPSIGAVLGALFFNDKGVIAVFGGQIENTEKF